MSDVQRIECTSPIDAVVVYAEGAVVRRALRVPENLEAGTAELVVGRVTPQLEPGSLRAEIQGERAVLSVRSSVRVGESPAPPGELRERIEALELRDAVLTRNMKLLARTGASLRSLALAPRWRGRRFAAAPDAKFEDALAAIALIEDTEANVEDRSDALRIEQDEVREQLATLRLELDQATADERRRAGEAWREIIVTVGAGGPIDSLSVSYAVSTARWWPAYTLRLTDAGTRATLSVDALIAQNTGEAWNGVALSLCTGDLARGLELPKLPSLRLGKRQPPRPPGYRPLPTDLGDLFAGYDRAAPAMPPPQAKPAPATETVMVTAGFASESEDEWDDFGGALADAPVSGGLERAAVASRSPAPASAPAPAAPAPQAKKAKLRARAFAVGASRGGGGAPGGTEVLMQASSQAAPPPPPPPLEPDDDWLDFDGLILRDPRAGGRGRLERRPRRHVSMGAIRTPAAVQSLTQTRGTFDHQWDAEATAEIPANGLAHRVTVTSATAAATPRLRAVPCVTPAVYREVHLHNPFPAPLLAGPMDVFLDRALLRQSPLATVDRGGDLRIGLGEEERVRVVRNARVRESTKGLLGGTTRVEHDIEIEVASSLGTPIGIDVIDRLPVTDDKEVEVRLTHSDPKAGSYDGADRGHPVRGGICWSIDLAPGEERRLLFSYAIEMDGKLEIQGGNRRD